METTIDKPKRRSTKRRGNGEGSICQRKSDGRWLASVVIGRDATGKRKRKVCYGWTKAEVQEKLAKLIPQAQDGTLANLSDLTVGAYFDRWIENSVRPNRRASTYDIYRRAADLYIKPFIGGVLLAKLMPANVEGLYSTMERQGLSGKLRQMVHGVLRTGLGKALKAGIVTRNVCDCVERPVAVRYDHTVLTKEQAVAFLQVSQTHRLHALFVLAITSGLRQGELLSLKWDDIDLDAGVVHVRRTVVQVNNTFVVNDPKTAKSRRQVEIPAIAVEALEEHRGRQLREGFAGDGRVFVGQRGAWLRRNSVIAQLRRLLELADCPRIRFHDLRHACASLMLLDGVNPKVVQERLGHSTISQTMDTYSHVMPTMQRDAADRLGSMLKIG